MKPLRFSLIELLIVVGIILLLVAFTVPLLAKSRERARRINCAMNLEQIARAVLMYTQQHDGFLPNLHPRQTTNWEPLGDPSYIEDPKVWNCPSRTDVAPGPTNSAYRYIGSGLKDNTAEPGTDSIAYDVYMNHPGNEWNNVLFLDGHVEGQNPALAPEFNNRLASE